MGITYDFGQQESPPRDRNKPIDNGRFVGPVRAVAGHRYIG